MASDPERLQTTLDELRRQLADVDSLDEASKNRLAAALQEIQTSLRMKARPEKSLLPRLRDAASTFEHSHPALSGAIGSVIDALGGMGI